MKTIQEVVERQLCTGCGACVFAEPDRFEMRETGDYCRRPFIKDSSVVETGAAIKICPGYQLNHTDLASQPEVVDKSYFPGWGPVIDVYEGFATDPDIRFKGSSGGAATALSLFALDDGAEGVLHTGASKETPYLNVSMYSRNADEVIGNAGSRYSPSSPCEKLSSCMAVGGGSAIVGKPCDIAAVHNLEKEDQDFQQKIHVKIGFFCAGTPSTNGLRSLLKKQSIVDFTKLRALKFRGDGWPGLWRATYENNSGEEEEKKLTYAESWGYLQKYRQWRCYICPDHTGEFADIAVGDPWYRTPKPGEIGQSLIVVRTLKGQEFLKRALEAGVIQLEKKDKSLLPASQPNLLKARGMLWGRLLALRLLGGAVPKYRNFSTFRFWLKELSAREKISSVLGTVKRVFRKDLNKKIQVKAESRID